MKNNKVKITILYDNESFRKDTKADWGFSCLVEMGGRKVLFDTGGSGSILLDNANVLNVNLKNIHNLFISHVHFDHIGGLSSLLDINKNIIIYAPSTLRGVFQAKSVLYEDKPAELFENFYTTGLLEDIEQSLAVRTKQGIVLIVGCSHPGLSTILDVVSKFGKPYAIIGGFHGFNEYELLQNIQYVCPTHCTEYIDEIKTIFPEKYLEGGVGRIIEL